MELVSAEANQSNVLEDLIEKNYPILSEEYIDVFLSNLLKIPYSSSYKVFLDDRQTIFRNQKEMYFMDNIHKRLAVFLFSPLEESSHKSFLRPETFFSHEISIIVIKSEINNIEELRRIFTSYSIPFHEHDTRIILKTSILLHNHKKYCSLSFSFLGNTVIGEDIYDIRDLRFCVYHRKIFDFDFNFHDFEYTGLEYPKCHACHWLKKRRLPFYECFQDDMDESLEKMNKEDLQNIIFFFDNIVVDPPDVILKITRKINKTQQFW